MYFRQMLDGANGCASYMLGCSVAGSVVVVDPLAEIGVEEYVLEAADRGLTITHIIDTHAHADHESVARELAEKTGAKLYLGAKMEASYPFEPLQDGDVITVGNVKIEIWETPGHTPESISLVVTDLTRTKEQPWLVLTGDSLFVGDVGRPDLVLGEGTEDINTRAATLYHSIFNKLLKLPDTVEVYPGHFGASACGGQHMSPKASSTIGFERRYNRVLQNKDVESFTRFVLGNLRPQPENYRDIKLRNLGQSQPAAH